MNIETEGLAVSFPGRGTPALDDVSITIDHAEHVVLLGPSGSGKTTLLRCILGGVTPDRGRVRVGGLTTARPAELRRIRRRAGVVRQETALVPGLRVQTNAVLGTAPAWRLREWAAVLRGGIPSRHAERVHALADALGIRDYLTDRVENLSRGQQQRLAVLRAVLPAPRLLLADEPTSGLDPVTARAAVDALLVEGTTVMLSTHDLDLARRFTRVIALRAGRLVHDGSGLSDRDIARIYPGTPVGT
ncbi:phosphonate ABC transporter ATP-binding protein [Streptomyces sp. 184]|uniref:phosphonate ABC transporter ATP-binding protein n=1 Tax=Streptomyces sp. 184 TaxID=1827526 RepID=UPI003892C759